MDACVIGLITAMFGCSEICKNIFKKIKMNFIIYIVLCNSNILILDHERQVKKNIELGMFLKATVST